MTPQEILAEFRDGKLTPEETAAQLAGLGDATAAFATVDLDRQRRCGAAEVIFAAGKSADQVVAIARKLSDAHGHVLITRVDAEQAAQLREHFTDYRTDDRQRTWLIGDAPAPRATRIPVVTAGTSDIPVADEARLTLETLGWTPHMIHDVGVAGLHRLFKRLPEIVDAPAIICIAGMEGALPSVLGGLVDRPVIAVPTSVGYGANLGGVTALLGMLTSCASGVTVVNIDNGFGAAYAAHQIARLAVRE